MLVKEGMEVEADGEGEGKWYEGRAGCAVGRREMFKGEGVRMSDIRVVEGGSRGYFVIVLGEMSCETILLSTKYLKDLRNHSLYSEASWPLRASPLPYSLPVDLAVPPCPWEYTLSHLLIWQAFLLRSYSSYTFDDFHIPSL
jgi:hypothetical protein